MPKKEKGKWRLVVENRQLHEATLPDAHPLPLIQNMLENQSKPNIFSIVDLNKGFHQNPLHPESGAKTAINLAGKRYQRRVMPMGIKNGPAIFQRVMDHVLQGLDCADVYIDDIIIGSSGETKEELLANHDRDMRAVLDRLRKEELVASVSKTNFFVHLVEFCGHVLEMTHAGRRQGKCWRLRFRKSQITFGSSEGSWGSPTIIRVMSKTTPP